MGSTMNLTESVRKIRGVVYALNNLEVKGRENLDILLGSMQTLDRTAADLEHGLKAMGEPQVSVEVVPEEEKPE